MIFMRVYFPFVIIYGWFEVKKVSIKDERQAEILPFPKRGEK